MKLKEKLLKIDEMISITQLLVLDQAYLREDVKAELDRVRLKIDDIVKELSEVYSIFSHSEH
jgi:hypothetical protein